MFGENGTAEGRSAAVRLDDLVADTVPVIIRRGGRDVVLDGYVWGRTIPRGIEARVKKAFRNFPRTVKPKLNPVTQELLIGPDGQPETEWEFEEDDYEAMLSQVICTLVPGITPIEADLIKPDKVRELLAALGYFKIGEDRPERPLAGQTTETKTGASSASDSPSPTDLVGVSS